MFIIISETAQVKWISRRQSERLFAFCESFCPARHKYFCIFLSAHIQKNFFDFHRILTFSLLLSDYFDRHSCKGRTIRRWVGKFLFRWIRDVTWLIRVKIRRRPRLSFANWNLAELGPQFGSPSYNSYNLIIYEPSRITCILYCGVYKCRVVSAKY